MWLRVSSGIVVPLARLLVVACLGLELLSWRRCCGVDGGGRGASAETYKVIFAIAPQLAGGSTVPGRRRGVVAVVWFCKEVIEVVAPPSMWSPLLPVYWSTLADVGFPASDKLAPSVVR